MEVYRIDWTLFGHTWKDTIEKLEVLKEGPKTFHVRMAAGYEFRVHKHDCYMTEAEAEAKIVAGIHRFCELNRQEREQMTLGLAYFAERQAVRQ